MLSEDELIARFFAAQGVRRSDVVVGIGDDAAVLAPPDGRHIVCTVDTINEGIHFPAGLAPDCIGYRAMAVNLSDLAAMGAEPAWATLSLSIPESNERWLGEFASGWFSLADRYSVALVGGDTIRGPLSISVSLQGFVEPGRQISRSGANPGDDLYVTGTLGDAAAGLSVLGTSDAPELSNRFLRPEPRVEIGLDLAGVATAAIDLSDGIARDLAKLAGDSGIAAELDSDRLPVSQSAIDALGESKARDYALAGGDDYELCFTLPPESRDYARSLAETHGVAVTRIGRMLAGSGIRLTGTAAATGLPLGWQHFQESPR